MFLPSPGTLVADKYQLESLLGEGGMGAVYRARHVLMDKPVALKWLRPELCTDADARERLIREAQSVARIHHPNVVQVFDVESHEGSLFLVMELLEGQTFADLISQRVLTTRQVIELLLSAMQGLSAAHERGIIHRDIKPENIFVVRDRAHPDGTAKLLDFGISKLTSHKAGSSRLTQTGHSVGTPLYMSVEQLTRGNDVDLRTDIYALGVVLYHALSGELPFEGETFAGIVLSIATTEPRSLKQLRPELPTALDRVVMKAMARDREDRYRNVDELIAALRQLDPVVGHPSPPRAYPATRTPGPPAANDTGDLLLEASLNELVHGQKAIFRRRLWVGLACMLALGTGALALSREPNRDAAANSAVAPTPPSLPAADVPPTAADAFPASPPLAPPAASAPGSVARAANDKPAPALHATHTDRATQKADQEAPSADSRRTSRRAHDDSKASHASRAARRAQRTAPSDAAPSVPLQARDAPGPTTPIAPAHETPTPSLRASTPSAPAPAKANVAGGLLRGDF